MSYRDASILTQALYHNNAAVHRNTEVLRKAITDLEIVTRLLDTIKIDEDGTSFKSIVQLFGEMQGERDRLRTELGKIKRQNEDTNRKLDRIIKKLKIESEG